MTLPRPSLTLVTDRVLYRPRADRKGDFLSLVEAAIAGGVDVVQLRARNAVADDLGLYAVALRLREMTAGKALFVMTGDVELAERSRADGVLLPERSYKPADARSFLRGVQPMPTAEAKALGAEAAEDGAPREHIRLGGGVKLVGAFARGVPGAGRAERGEADYVQVGPIFGDAVGTGAEAPGDDGLTLLRKVKDAVQIPVIAFGGVATPAHATDCLRAGADGVAVTDAILQAPDPQAAALALRSAIDAAWRVLHG